VGLNLTAASCALFLEMGWASGEHLQAEDRLLRIGQGRSVSIYYLVSRGTIEDRLLDIITTKEGTFGRIIEGKRSHGAMALLKVIMNDSQKPR
jgi:SWI/SNF-related matrix-associated actin-dependent regulator 1 of chromatin subfamily A